MVVSPDALYRNVLEMYCTRNDRHIQHMVQKCTILQPLLVTAYLAVYLNSLTPDTVPSFDTCILQHITEPCCDSALVAHSRLLPSLITQQAAISQQKLGITIEVLQTESPTRPCAHTAIHFNRDVPSGEKKGKIIGEQKWLISCCDVNRQLM